MYRLMPLSVKLEREVRREWGRKAGRKLIFFAVLFLTLYCNYIFLRSYTRNTASVSWPVVSIWALCMLIFLFISVDIGLCFFVVFLFCFGFFSNNVPFFLFSEDALYTKKSTRKTKLLRALQVYKRFAVWICTLFPGIYRLKECKRNNLWLW